MITQLEHALTLDPSVFSLPAYEKLRLCMDTIFTFIQKQCTDDAVSQKVSKILADRPCILFDRTNVESRADKEGARTSTGYGRFLRPSQVAFDFTFNCAPYLYGMPSERAKKHERLLSLIGVKPCFEVCDCGLIELWFVNEFLLAYHYS